MSDPRQTINELFRTLDPSAKLDVLRDLDELVEPFYQIVDSDALEQGDILEDIRVFAPPASVAADNLDDVKFTWVAFDVVVMSQSCDIVKGPEKVEDVLVCATFRVSEFGDKDPLTSTWNLEEIRRLNRPALHLLPEVTLPDHQCGFRLVQFSRLYSLPIAYVRNHAAAQGPRLQLLSPYREHLSQAFARFFMRVGLPSDLPNFVTERNESEITKRLSLLDEERFERVVRAARPNTT